MNLLPSLSRRRGLSAWDPFEDLFNLQANLNHLWRPFGNGDNGGEPGEALWAPAMDVVETDKEIRLKFDVPGIDKKDIKVQADNGVLSITGERRIEKEEKKEDFTRIERSYGSFSRSLTLPDYVNAEKIGAEVKDGVLRVTLPKINGAKAAPKAIEIK